MEVLVLQLQKSKTLISINRISTRTRKEYIAGILFTLPMVLGLIIFVIYPMISSLYYSLTDYNILSGAKWIGFDNYKTIFTTDIYFKKALFVTIYYSFASVIANLVSALLVALLLNQNIKGQSVYRTIFYLPNIVPAVSSSMLWIWLFNPDFGLLNSILSFLGLPKSMWIFGESTVIPSLILMGVWGIGNTIVIFLAGLQDVPRSLHEAVEIDGGNWFHKFKYVTLPMITPIIFFNLIMGIIGGFQTFTQAYVMTNGGPNNASLFYVFYLYRVAFQNGKMGYASALAWILFIIVAGLTMLLFKTSKKWVYYGEGHD